MSKDKLYFQDKQLKLAAAADAIKVLIDEYKQPVQDDNQERLDFIRRNIMQIYTDAWDNFHDTYRFIYINTRILTCKTNKRIYPHFNVIYKSMLSLLTFLRDQDFLDFELEFIEKEGDIKKIIIEYKYLLKLQKYWKKVKKQKKEMNECDGLVESLSYPDGCREMLGERLLYPDGRGVDTVKFRKILDSMINRKEGGK